MVSSEKRCPVLNNQICSDCPNAEREWDMDSLFEDLGFAKAVQNILGTADVTDKDIEEFNIEKEELTLTEKCWLGLLLSGLTPEDIAAKLNREIRGLTSDFSRTLYKYVKHVAKKKVSDWAQVILYLDRKGYRKKSIMAKPKKLIRIQLEIEVDGEAENILPNTLIDSLHKKYAQGLIVKQFYYEENE